MYRRFYVTLLLISGLVLFAFSLLAAYREVTPEWKRYQSEYKELFTENAKDEFMREKARSFEIEIQQIYLESLGKVDRCTNCHIGVENPLMADAEIPFKQHGGNYLDNHPVSRFGCTVCHYGQGRATNKKEAHGEGHDTHWDYPIIPLKYIQSSCAKCHDYEMLKKNSVEKVVKGRKLFREKGCRGCHKLNGVGGVLGKVLDGVGSQPIAYFPMRHVKGDKTVYSWMKEHFIDPREIVPESEMKVLLAGEEADLLTTYILTVRSGEIPKEYRRIRHIDGTKTDGKSLYKMYCIACHTTGEFSIYDEIFKRTIPAIMNPAFSKAIGDKYLKKIIEEGRTDTQMTAWKADAAGVSDEEINRIVKYLTRNRPEEKPEPFGFAGFKSDIKRGESLFVERCVMCHGSDGKGGKGVLGISLKNPIVQGADPEFLAITIRDGRLGTPMVPFGETGLKLKGQDIADIVTYVKNLPDKKAENTTEDN